MQNELAAPPSVDDLYVAPPMGPSVSKRSGWRTFGLIVGIIAWVGFVALMWVGFTFEAWFACGGTFGGYGASASDGLDQVCYDRRTDRVSIIALLGLFGPFVLRWEYGRQR